MGQDSSQITRKKIRNFLLMLNEIGVRPATVRRELAAVKSFCTWLHGQGLIDVSLIRSIRGPRPHDVLPDVPSETDMKQLLEGDIPGPCPKRDRAMLELLYGAGLRASELIGINMSDFKEKRVLLIRGKGNKERFVAFGECARHAIDAWLPVRKRLMRKFDLQTDALFFQAKQANAALEVAVREAIASPNPPTQDELARQLGVNQSRISVLFRRAKQGGYQKRQKTPERMDVRSVARVIKRVAEANGLPPFNPHALRHACATHMHDHGAPLQEIAIQLGHQNLDTAQIYTRVSTGRKLEVYRKAHPHARRIA